MIAYLYVIACHRVCFSCLFMYLLCRILVCASVHVACIVSYANNHCIVFIHFYSTFHGHSLSQALTTTAIDIVSEFTHQSAKGNCK